MQPDQQGDLFGAPPARDRVCRVDGSFGRWFRQELHRRARFSFHSSVERPQVFERQPFNRLDDVDHRDPGPVARGESAGQL